LYRLFNVTGLASIPMNFTNKTISHCVCFIDQIKTGSVAILKWFPIAEIIIQHILVGNLNSFTFWLALLFRNQILGDESRWLLIHDRCAPVSLTKESLDSSCSSRMSNATWTFQASC